MIYIGTITEIHLNPDGLPVFSVTDPHNNIFYPCTITSTLGGFDGRFTHPSLTEGARVILMAYGEGYVRCYYAIGFLIDNDDAIAISVDGVRTAIEAEAAAGRDRLSPDVEDERESYQRNEDYPGTHVEDMHLEVQDSFVNMSVPHGLTLQGYPRVSVQIPEDAGQAAFRVSAGGNASNFVLNAVPHLDRLYNYIGTLQQKIDALEAAVNAMAPGVVAAYEAAAAAADVAAPGSGAPIRQQSTDATNALAEATALGPLTPATTIREESDQDVNAYVIIP